MRRLFLLLPIAGISRLFAQAVRTKVGEDQQEARQPLSFPSIWLRGATPGAGGIPVTVDAATMTLDPITKVLSAKIPPPGTGTVPIFVDGEVPAGNLPGSIFSLNGSPNPPSSLQLFVNGVYQRQGSANDYTLNGNTINFIAPVVLSAGSVVAAHYRK